MLTRYPLDVYWYRVRNISLNLNLSLLGTKQLIHSVDINCF